MKRIELKAYAKINLSIDVLRRRSDGYHDVSMIMQLINLFDEIKVEYKEGKEPFEISLSTDMKDLPIDKNNLAYRAAELITTYYCDDKGGKIEIHIAKKIPLAAGLAGGSADAAAVLHALNKLLNLELSLDQLKELGMKLGADVPFCVMGQAAILDFPKDQASTCAHAEGIGELLTPIKPLESWLVLSKPPVNVSTKDIYQSLNVSEIKKRPDNLSLIDGLKEENFEKITSSMFNVLEEVSESKFGEIGKTKDIMARIKGDHKVMMTGSGPTVFAISKDYLTAEKIFNEVREYNKDTFLVNTLN
ncbi:MAG: 4-(cytidine 5'-diphospho)-2-C-methyl-D-erythritol kinase [Clostridiales bacterium]|nr:4-(cytidine 5'-diphospho)-2-C-methyl-D-erythritol kinase [Clostridiales bacterium]